MRSEEVAEFLKEHPEFFEHYAGLLAEIYIPHPQGGRAIPISERQILTLREKNRQLEGKLREVIQYGEENDAISEKVHRISLALLAASELLAVLNAVYLNLREDFAVPHAALRFYVMGERASTILVVGTLAEEQHSLRLPVARLRLEPQKMRLARPRDAQQGCQANCRQ